MPHQQYKQEPHVLYSTHFICLLTTLLTAHQAHLIGQYGGIGKCIPHPTGICKRSRPTDFFAHLEHSCAKMQVKFRYTKLFSFCSFLQTTSSPTECFWIHPFSQSCIATQSYTNDLNYSSLQMYLNTPWTYHWSDDIKTRQDSRSLNVSALYSVEKSAVCSLRSNFHSFHERCSHRLLTELKLLR